MAGGYTMSIIQYINESLVSEGASEETMAMANEIREYITSLVDNQTANPFIDDPNDYGVYRATFNLSDASNTDQDRDMTIILQPNEGNGTVNGDIDGDTIIMDYPLGMKELLDGEGTNNPIVQKAIIGSPAFFNQLIRYI